MRQSVAVPRRSFLQGAAAGLFTSMMAAPTPIQAAPAHLTFDLSQKADLSLIFRKLGYSMDSTLGFWYLNAIRYGLVGTKLFPFWNIHIGRFFVAHNLPDGGYSVTQLGLTFYTDIKTGEYLRRFQNPLTGKTVEIPYGQPKPRLFAAPVPGAAFYQPIEARGTEPAGSHNPTLTTVGELGPAWIQGNNIWIQQDHLLEYPAPHKPGQSAHVNDLTSYFGSLSEVANPNIKMPHAGHAFTDINDWPEWLEMGAQPGAYYSRGVGFKAFALSDMPATWRKLAQQHYPAIIQNPLKALQLS